MKLSRLCKAVFVGAALLAMLQDTLLDARVSSSVKFETKEKEVFDAINDCGSATGQQLTYFFGYDGVDINVVEKATGNTPLIAATKRGCKNIISFLIINGADPDARDRDGKTALQWAVAKNDTEITRALLQQSPRAIGLTSKVQRYVGWKKPYTNDFTDLLVLAVERNNEAMVRDLIAAGADPDAKNAQGKTATGAAKSDSMKKILKLHGFFDIEDTGIDIDKPQKPVLEEGWTDIPGW